MFHICFPCYFSGKALNPPKKEKSHAVDFELTDKLAGSALCNSGQGEAAYHNVGNDPLNIYHIDSFFKQLNGRDFMHGNSNVCDYLLVKGEGDKESVIVLNELTVALDRESLRKPIKGKDGSVRFAEGKWEKAVTQLESTLSLLQKHPCVSNVISKYGRKICLFSYRISSLDIAGIPGLSAFMAYRQIEAMETGNSGAKIRNSKIEGCGFEYYRISYPNKFAI